MPTMVCGATRLNSYGTHKAIGELLINDYTRKGLIDGSVVQLATVIVGPGLPNHAASTFAASIIREPPSAREAGCPVSPDTIMASAAPRAEALGFTADRGIDDVVRMFIEDDLDAQKRLAEG